tara:strand:+ start:66902 stop:67708 length:807 start_codon:yes stop_codon:yes gene_type:complete
MNEKIAISFNSAILYVIAFLLTTVFHELAHALTGFLLGSSPTLHHNFVSHATIIDLTLFQKTVVALAGPVISLIQGLLAGYGYYKLRKKAHTLLHLFLLWFSVLGLYNFLGYLMTGLFFKNGDIGKVYLMTQTPYWLQIGLALIATLLFTFIAYKMTRPFLQMSYKMEWLDSGANRKNFSFHVLFLPWMVGSVITTLLYLPVIAIVSIIYPISSGMIFIFPWQNADTITDVVPSSNSRIGKISTINVAFLVALMLLFRGILAPGIHLN